MGTCARAQCAYVYAGAIDNHFHIPIYLFGWAGHRALKCRYDPLVDDTSWLCSQCYSSWETCGSQEEMGMNIHLLRHKQTEENYGLRIYYRHQAQDVCTQQLIPWETLQNVIIPHTRPIYSSLTCEQTIPNRQRELIGK